MSNRGGTKRSSWLIFRRRLILIRTLLRSSLPRDALIAAVNQEMQGEGYLGDTVTLHPQVARRQDIATHFPGTVIDYHDDGSATVTATITNLWHARRTLLRYGSACTVHAPVELVDLFRNAIREMAANYGVALPDLDEA